MMKMFHVVVLFFSLVLASDAGPNKIIFCRETAGSWSIWEVNSEGGDLRQLLKPKDSGNDVDPVFSPDCKTILFTSTRSGAAGIWRVAYEGKEEPIRICDGDQAEWSPDGTKIVFRRSEKIIVRDLATNKEKIITPSDWPHCSAPSWSPDGKQIAFAARWDAGNGLYLVSPDGGKPTKLYDKEGACEAHWSADSQRILYETETRIRIINADGTGNKLVTYFGGVQRYARFSPDNKSAVFCQGESENGPWELYMISLSGGAPKKITGDNSDMHPDWR